jgi:hypothetical protein
MTGHMKLPGRRKSGREIGRLCLNSSSRRQDMRCITFSLVYFFLTIIPQEGELFVLAEKHRTLQTELNKLYDSIFSGKTPGAFPGSKMDILELYRLQVMMKRTTSKTKSRHPERFTTVYPQRRRPKTECTTFWFKRGLF